MANADVVLGAKPKGPVLRMSEYVAGAVCYPGDLVKFNADGKVEPITAADASCGVAMAYAAANANVLVADHPDQLFEMQADDATIDAQTDLLLNYQVAVGTASTLYRRSAMEIDGNTGATNSNYPIKVIKVIDRPDNALGEFVKCVVKINNHQLGEGTGTLGV
jgi:hypothetical protein